MKNVKTLIIVTLMGASLFASSQRVAALGGNVGFWPEDDASWTTFPTAINDLDMVQISGVDGDASASIVWGEGTTWGFQYNEADMAAEDWDAIDWMNIGWGNGTYGATFSLGSQSYDSGETGSTASSMTAFGATFGTVLAGGDFGAGFSSMSQDNGNDDSDDDPTSMGIGFSLRRAQSLWLFDNMLVGFANVSSATGDMTASAMDLSVDLFTHIPANESISVLFALGFGYSSSVSNCGATGCEDITASVMSLPQATLAVEGDLKDWATVRVGVNHAYVMGTDGDASWSGAYTEDGSTFNMTFGLGFNMGSFNLDMTVGEGLFSDPAPYLVGQNDESLSEGGVTLTYAF